jgi:hypothetical protein
MSYDLTLQCGCVVYVAANPATRVAHTRIIQSRGAQCAVRRHEIGLRLYLWELLPEARATGNRRPAFGEKSADWG